MIISIVIINWKPSFPVLSNRSRFTILLTIQKPYHLPRFDLFILLPSHRICQRLIFNGIRFRRAFTDFPFRISLLYLTSLLRMSSRFSRWLSFTEKTWSSQHILNPITKILFVTRKKHFYLCWIPLLRSFNLPRNRKVILRFGFPVYIEIVCA